MRFQTAGSFEKHLHASFPDHLARLYLFVSACEYEKRVWRELLLSVLKRKEPHLTFTRFDATQVPAGVIQDEVRAPGLWGGWRVLWVDQIDRVKPLDPFLHLLPLASSEVVLIFSASSAKPVAGLYQKGKKELVVLDVSEEKPWDREKRLQEWIRELARQEGKQVTLEVAGELLHHLGTDLATLHQEFKKLVTYVGDKSVITPADIEAICGSKDLTTSWQLAETIVWRHPVSLEGKAADPGFVFPFVGQVRYHLQLGAQIADFIERKTPLQELKKQFPAVRPHNLDKFIPTARARGVPFFLNGLLQLYELEYAAKSASLDMGVAFDIFQARMHRSL